MHHDDECPQKVYVVWTATGSGEVFGSLTEAEQAVKDYEVHSPDDGPYLICSYDRQEAG